MLTTSPYLKRFRVHTMIQIILLTIALVLYLSKISIFPWFTPLTTYMLLYMVLLGFAQFFFFLVNWHLLEKDKTFKELHLIAILFFVIIFIMGYICVASTQTFYILSVIFSLLICYLIFRLIKSLRAI